jgi:hypothetical protein
MSKREYDTSGYPIERDSLTMNLVWALAGVCLLAVTAGLTVVAVTLFHVIFG